MSYYIAPQKNNLEIGQVIVYRVVKRLSDFKPEEGKRYRVFPSKKEMKESLTVPIYIGAGGKLKKLGHAIEIRF